MVSLMQRKTGWIFDFLLLSVCVYLAVLASTPFGKDMAEVEEVLKAAEGNPEKIFLANFELRFLPSVQALRGVLQEGGIGELQEVRVSFRTNTRARFGRKYTWWHEVSTMGAPVKCRLDC